MNQLCIKRRWAPIWVGLIVVGIYGFFGWVVLSTFYSATGVEEAIRIFIPPYGLAGYLVLMLIANSQTALVTPHFVRVVAGPFPGARRTTLLREDIQLCYARHVRTYDDGQEVENYFMAGVESPKGKQLDVSGPHKSYEEGRRAADDIIRVLNAIPGRKAVEVRGPSRESAPDWGQKLRILAWGAAFLLSIIAGAAWQIVAMRM